MGMSTHVVGFISSDNVLYQKHLKVLEACIAADIKELPTETAKYFNSKYPEEYLAEEKLEIRIPTHEYDGDMQEGYEIIVSEIPVGVHKIRFVNSY
jgi:hypothetical protein